MSKQMRKTLGIFLAVCFLMSITAAAISADPVDKSLTSQKNTKGVVQGMQEKNVYVRNLIVARNVVIFSGRGTTPVLRAAVLKRVMNNTGTTDNTTADNITTDNITADIITTDNITADNTTADNITTYNITDDNTNAKNVKELLQGKIVFVRNLIIARNVVIFNGRSTRPLLRAAVLKRMMNNTGTTDNTGDNMGTADNTYDNTT